MMKMRRVDVALGRCVAAIGLVYVLLARLLHVPPAPDDRAPFSTPSFGRASRMPVATRWGRASSPVRASQP